MATFGLVCTSPYYEVETDDGRWRIAIDYQQGLRGWLFYRLRSGEAGIARPGRWRKSATPYAITYSADGTKVVSIAPRADAAKEVR